ncbi:MAG: cupin domain-containing protein [Micrococcales bacterium]|nr:cupin domain-containing protein [Micrococcales bacterium]
MKSFKLEDMIGGWFVGAFEPAALSTSDVEVAVKRYSAGDKESAHFHKVATEVTLIVEGTVSMMGREWSAGDIVVLSPGEATSFEAITDAINVVVKLPGALNDKYLVSEEKELP